MYNFQTAEIEREKTLTEPENNKKDKNIIDFPPEIMQSRRGWGLNVYNFERKSTNLEFYMQK